LLTRLHLKTPPLSTLPLLVSLHKVLRDWRFGGGERRICLSSHLLNAIREDTRMISARTDQDTIASTNLQRLGKNRQSDRRSSKRLLAYAAAAGAACSTQAAAEVVYTPAHDSLFNGTYFLDLNHDGINDFAFAANGQLSTFSRRDCVRVQPLVAGNRIL